MVGRTLIEAVGRFLGIAMPFGAWALAVPEDLERGCEAIAALNLIPGTAVGSVAAQPMRGFSSAGEYSL